MTGIADPQHEAFLARERERYRPALDGLRGIAVLGVLMFHSSSRDYLPGLYRGGKFGVDVFFVLSGYLITGLLLAEQQHHGVFSLGKFYARRALRLLPALFLFLAFVGVTTLVLGNNASGKPFLLAMIPVLLYVGNWAVALNNTSLGYMGHTWTLALEEQFYLFWPLILKWALKRDPTCRRIAAGLLSVVVLLGLLRALLTALEVSNYNYNFGWRFDGLLLGSFVAVFIERIDTGAWRRRLQSPVLALVAFVLLGWLTLVLPTRFKLEGSGGLTMVFVLAAIVVAYAALADQNRGLNQLFSFRPLAALGRISYGVYLFHIPVNALVHATPASRLPPVVEVAIHQTASIALAAASYLLIERRILALKSRFQPLDSSPATTTASQPM